MQFLTYKRYVHFFVSSSTSANWSSHCINHMKIMTIHANETLTLFNTSRHIRNVTIGELHFWCYRIEHVFASDDNLDIQTGTFSLLLMYNSLLEKISGKSSIDFLLSFVFPGTFNIMFIMLSKTLFSIYITSRLWSKSRSFQYGSFQKILFLCQLCLTP